MPVAMVLHLIENIVKRILRKADIKMMNNNVDWMRMLAEKQGRISADQCNPKRIDFNERKCLVIRCF